MKRDRTKENAVREHRRKHDPLFVAKELYDKQVHRAKTHSYKTIEYTRDEFLEWVDNTNYNKLFALWVESGHDKYMKPSIDRVDATKGYSFDNIQMMTWGENDAKGRHENSTTKSILQFTKDGEFIREWDSVVEATRELAPDIKNPHKSKLYNHLKRHKHYNSFHGYIFHYKEGYRL